MGNENSDHFKFCIIYKDRETILQFPRDQTVGDLKKEIYKKNHILPSDQIIQSWVRPPQDDNTILETCCSKTDLNFLVVYNSSDLAQENSTIMPNDDIEMSAEVECNDVKLEESEINAIASFIEYFSKYYDDTGLLFHFCSINNAVEEACFTSLESRKILLLYFHNSEDQFAGTFCKNLAKHEVKVVLNSKFFILGWDVGNETYHNALKEALNKCCDLSNLKNFIEMKTCAAVLVVPIKDSLIIYSCMKGKVSDSDFISTLRQGEEFLSSETSIEQDLEHISTRENDMGSENYQQLMFDLLGDRDYDSFDYSEHELLKDKIGFALFGPPQEENGYEKKQKKQIEVLFKVILKENNIYTKWKDRVIISFIYACIEPLPKEKLKRSKKYKDYNPKTDLSPQPIFILRKCKDSVNPCRIFIDCTGRVYQSWMEYIHRNKLDECQMILPKNGRYEPDSNGKVLLEKHLSPACGIDMKILLGLDIGSTAAGLLSGGVFLAAAVPAITVAPPLLIAAGVTGIGVGLYSVGRSAYSLYDRNRHKESMSFAHSEARGAYLNIVAGSLGFVGAGANVAVAQLATKGFQIGQGATAAVNVIGIANISASGIGIANSSYDVLDRWLRENQSPSLLTIVQLSSSILFFGHAVYNFKLAGTIIEEAQASTLSEYQESLRSNRHRKTFNKILKETIKQNDGNINKGQAEVISTLQNIKNKDEVFAALTRSNKDMNKYGLKFSAENGEIKLNGHYTINFDQFSQMDKVERITFLSQIQSVAPSEPTGSQVSSMIVRLKHLLPEKISVNELATLGFNLAKIFGNTSDDIKDKIINAVCMLLDWLTGGGANYMRVLDKVFPHHEKYFKLINMVSGFFQTLINKVEEGYQKWKATQDPEIEDPIYLTLSLDYAKRAVEIFNFISKVYFIGNNLTEQGLKILLNYFYTWVAKQVVTYEEYVERKQLRSAHSSTPSPQVNCSICGGCYYNSPKNK